MCYPFWCCLQLLHVLEFLVLFSFCVSIWEISIGPSSNSLALTKLLRYSPLKTIALPFSTLHHHRANTQWVTAKRTVRSRHAPKIREDSETRALEVSESFGIHRTNSKQSLTLSQINSNPQWRPVLPQNLVQVQCTCCSAKDYEVYILKDKKTNALWGDKVTTTVRFSYGINVGIIRQVI